MTPEKMELTPRWQDAESVLPNAESNGRTSDPTRTPG